MGYFRYLKSSGLQPCSLKKRLKLLTIFHLICFCYFHCQVCTGQWGWGWWRQTWAKLHSAVSARHGQSPDPFCSRVSWSSWPDQLHAGHWLAGRHHRAGVGLPEGRGPPDCAATGQENTGGTWHGDDHNPGRPWASFPGALHKWSHM